MNLPPAVRFKLENICIIGTTPIPYTPDPYTISHVIQIITNEVLAFSTPDGIILPTSHHAQGVLVECFIIPVIADLQAIRKFCGFLSHSANMFCWFCLCTKSEIEQLDFTSWELRDGATVRVQAEEWRNMTATGTREAFSRKTGVRWTPMHSLPYWNPVSHTLLGFMHNWLEGILQHQLRTLWGIGRSKKLDELSQDLGDASEQFSDSDLSESSSELAELEEEEQGFLATESQRQSMFRSTNMDIDDDGNSSSDEFPPPSPQLFFSDNEGSDTETIQDLDYTPEDLPLLFKFSDAQIQEIRNAVQNITLPTWVARLPENLGEESHGKLKAQEYLTLFTVILPLILPELWHGTQEESLALLESFHHLVSATNIIASFTTSNAMADSYTHHYTLYRQSIQQLFPQIRSKPNHHYAGHNGDLLKFWGPLAALSEFPGERINGMMQRVKTSRQKSKCMGDMYSKL